MKEEMRQLGAHEYPAQLREIPQPPPVLWARGSFPPPHTKLLAVVGSRALSPYGREACQELIRGLAGYPLSIVSGLALGADACAHEAALAAGLHTIAVPGSGLSPEALYPRSNVGIAERILEAGGLLLSEHEGGHKARPEDFPSRNRIMVGLADAVLVIEAGERSGTLITARLAHEYNRDLLCVPHRIGDSHGFAAKLFIRLGAGLVAEPAHILEALGLERQSTERQMTLPTLSADEHHIYTLLTEPLSRDELVRAAKLPSGQVLTLLVSLELKGVLEEKFGTWRRVAI